MNIQKRKRTIRIFAFILCIYSLFIGCKSNSDSNMVMAIAKGVIIENDDYYSRFFSQTPRMVTNKGSLEVRNSNIDVIQIIQKG